MSLCELPTVLELRLALVVLVVDREFERSRNHVTYLYPSRSRNHVTYLYPSQSRYHVTYLYPSRSIESMSI
jgi:hypothetical protein